MSITPTPDPRHDFVNSLGDNEAFYDQHPTVRDAMPAWADTATVTSYWWGEVEVTYHRRYTSLGGAVTGAISTGGYIIDGQVGELDDPYVSISLEGGIGDLEAVAEMVTDMQRRLSIAPIDGEARS